MGGGAGLQQPAQLLVHVIHGRQWPVVRGHPAARGDLGGARQDVVQRVQYAVTRALRSTVNGIGREQQDGEHDGQAAADQSVVDAFGNRRHCDTGPAPGSTKRPSD